MDNSPDPGPGPGDVIAPTPLLIEDGSALNGPDFPISHEFTYTDIAKATSGFSRRNRLGRGGYGEVFKGVLEGRDVAVKRLNGVSDFGELEFQKEVEVLTKVKHKHIVSFLGYCKTPRKILVFELVPNNTLYFHLHGSVKIIHRDIKSSNILLDYNFDAIIADFGLSKINYADASHVITDVVGTSGYLAPEYMATQKLTWRSDVYSYGIVLVELITGLRRPDFNVGEIRKSLMQALDTKNFSIVIDKDLGTGYNQEEMSRLLECASVCILDAAAHRPRMSLVVKVLEGTVHASELKVGINPWDDSRFRRMCGISCSGSDQDSNGAEGLGG